MTTFYIDTFFSIGYSGNKYFMDYQISVFVIPASFGNLACEFRFSYSFALSCL